MRSTTHLQFDRIERIWRENQTVDGLLCKFLLKCSKQPIPDDQNASVVFVQQILIRACKERPIIYFFTFDTLNEESRP